jgi:hypothetical protein
MPTGTRGKLNESRGIQINASQAMGIYANSTVKSPTSPEHCYDSRKLDSTGLGKRMPVIIMPVSQCKNKALINLALLISTSIHARIRPTI